MKQRLKIRKKFISEFWGPRWTYTCPCGATGHTHTFDQIMKMVTTHCFWTEVDHGRRV